MEPNPLATAREALFEAHPVGNWVESETLTQPFLQGNRGPNSKIIPEETPTTKAGRVPAGNTHDNASLGSVFASSPGWQAGRMPRTSARRPWAGAFLHGEQTGSGLGGLLWGRTKLLT